MFRAVLVAVYVLAGCGSEAPAPAAKALLDGQLVLQAICRGEADSAFRTRARAQLTRARQLASDDVLRLQADLGLAELNLLNGDLPRARAAARSVLARAGTTEVGRFAAADLAHATHTLLGRIALKEGNVTQAIEALDASMQISGSPNLQNVGPSFDLAQALLNAGETAAVLRYLTWAEGYWALVTSYGAPTRWKDQLERGQRPQMSRNDC